ncbi:hypothetical protein ACJX0J_031583, partial [Zea mays]
RKLLSVVWVFEHVFRRLIIVHFHLSGDNKHMVIWTKVLKTYIVFNIVRMTGIWLHPDKYHVFLL